MVDNIVSNDDIDFQKAYEESFKEIQENSIIKASVVDISGDTVFMDFGYKSEAKVPCSEFSVLPKVGDMVEIYLIRLEGNNGQPVVSRSVVNYYINRQSIKDVLKERKPITVVVKDVKKAGCIVDYKGVKGFIPISLFDVDRQVTMDSFLNKEIEIFIERIDFNDDPFEKNNKNNNRKSEEFIGNRKKSVIEKLNSLKNSFFDEKHEGDILNGTVKAITDFGAFVDVGGVDALLRLKDIAWVRFNKIEDVLKINDKIKVKILSINTKNRKITVGLKQLLADPWDEFAEKYNVDDVVNGTVVSVTTYGAFVKIYDGVEGLLHVSDMSWIKKINNPLELVKVGQSLELKIIKLDKENKKVSLSLKHLLDNPWSQAAARYKEGTIIVGKVKSITAFGFFIELEEGIDALLHIDDISWTETVKNPYEYYKVGDEIQAVILQCDADTSKIKIGIKQLTDDPWKVLRDSYNKGDAIDCIVENIDDEKGLIVKVTDKITCLIPYMHIDIGRIEEIKTRIRNDYKIGQSVTALVTNIDTRRKNIALSIKEYLKKKEREHVKNFLHDINEDSKYTLGESIKIKNDE